MDGSLRSSFPPHYIVFYRISNNVSSENPTQPTLVTRASGMKLPYKFPRRVTTTRPIIRELLERDEEQQQPGILQATTAG